MLFQYKDDGVFFLQLSPCFHFLTICLRGRPSHDGNPIEQRRRNSSSNIIWKTTLINTGAFRQSVRLNILPPGRNDEKDPAYNEDQFYSAYFSVVYGQLTVVFSRPEAAVGSSLAKQTKDSYASKGKK